MKAMMYAKKIGGTKEMKMMTGKEAVSSVGKANKRVMGGKEMRHTTAKQGM